MIFSEQVGTQNPEWALKKSVTSLSSPFFQNIYQLPIMQKMFRHQKAWGREGRRDVFDFQDIKEERGANTCASQAFPRPTLYVKETKAQEN